MTKGGKSIWKRIRGHAVAVAAWGLVLIALGVAGLWVDWENITMAGYQWADRNHDTLRTVHAFSGARVIIVSWARFVVPHYLIDHSKSGSGFYRKKENQDLVFGAFRRNLSSGNGGWTCGSFGLMRVRDSRTARDGANGVRYSLMFPHWFVLLLLLAWPAKRGWRWLELRRRRRKGLCLNCGYDLRASPERCPECGTARAGNDEFRNSNDERMPKQE